MEETHAPGILLRRALLRELHSYVVMAAVFSAIINILYLTPSIYMLQVYDRVVPTGGRITLLLLSVVMVGALAAVGLLDWLRARVLHKAGSRLEAQLAGPVLAALLAAPRLGATERAQAIREVDALRGVVTGGAATAILDAPWTPVYVLVAFLLHPWLGVFTLAAGALILVLAWRNERATHRLFSEANAATAAANARVAQVTARSGEIRALGMVGTVARRAIADRAGAEEATATAGRRAAAYASLAKFVRITAQSAVLAVAALLAINGSITAGAITVGTLLLGRALAPIELLVGSWRSVIRAESALKVLARVLGATEARSFTSLPRPAGALAIERLTVGTPTGDRVAIADVSFAVAPGEVIAVVGLSGAGKSTLLRALVGEAPALRGAIRLDGASLADWDPERLGRLIGYVPQERVVFSGTVKDNIARFDTAAPDAADALDAAVIAAARRAGAHDMILRLPAGYDTRLGVDGVGLSSGQAQRVTLARACYGEPALMIMDEPCANLDTDGRIALRELIQANRTAGVTTIFSSHERDLVQLADKVLLLAGGQVARFGAIEVKPGAPSPAAALHQA